MINLHRLELPMSRTNFHGPKDVRAIEVRLYVYDAASQWAHGVLIQRRIARLCLIKEHDRKYRF